MKKLLTNFIIIQTKRHDIQRVKGCLATGQGHNLYCIGNLYRNDSLQI